MGIKYRSYEYTVGSTSWCNSVMSAVTVRTSGKQIIIELTVKVVTEVRVRTEIHVGSNETTVTGALSLNPLGLINSIVMTCPTCRKYCKVLWAFTSNGTTGVKSHIYDYKTSVSVHQNETNDYTEFVNPRKKLY
jgi:hypothetical protein